MNANVRSAGRRTLTRRIGDAVRSCLMKQPAVWRRGERGSNPGERGARALVFFFFLNRARIGRTERGDPPLRGARPVGRGHRRYRPLARGFILGPLHRFTCGVSGADTGSAFFSGTAAENNLGATKNPTDSNPTVFREGRDGTVTRLPSRRAMAPGRARRDSDIGRAARRPGGFDLPRRLRLSLQGNGAGGHGKKSPAPN